MRTLLGLLIVFTITVTSVTPLFGQESGGTLLGYVKDDTGAVLPGVTISATSPALIGTRTVASDAQGYYRLLNLPPGQYVLTAELQGFATYRQEGIVVRAGVTLSQEVAMKLSSMKETVTVKGESPMLEVGTSSHALNISGDFQREIPIQARRSYADFLEMSTGIITRPIDDNSGRVSYVGHGVDSWAYAIQLEGSNAVNYQDPGAQNIAMSTEIIADTNVKLAGVPASEPMTVGLVVNIVTKSGGDRFSGAATYTFEPFSWNGNNVPAGLRRSTSPISRSGDRSSEGRRGSLERTGIRTR
jgi:Carboxypeptidase regulatory-like domain